MAIIEILRSIPFIPHFICFRFSHERDIIMKDILENSRHRCYSGSIFFAFSYLMRDPSFRTVFYKRIGGISRFLSLYAKKEKSFIIGTDHIGGGFYAPHAFSTIINARSIGERFSCRQCTTIGNKGDGRNDLIPVIGNDVTVGANTVIIGAITIGDNVIIGAGSVVVHDIPANSIVAGNPARVIRSSFK